MKESVPEGNNDSLLSLAFPPSFGISDIVGECLKGGGASILLCLIYIAAPAIAVEAVIECVRA